MNTANDKNQIARPARFLLPILLTQAVGLVCGVAGIKISSHLVAPADYGAFGVFLTLTPLGIWVVHAGLIKFVGRHWAASPNRAGLMREVAMTAIRRLPMLALITFAAVWLVPGLRKNTGLGIRNLEWHDGETWWTIWILLFFGATFASAAQIAQTTLQAGREHWKDFDASAAGSLTRSFVPPLLYAVSGGMLMALQCGFVVHAFVLTCAAAWAVRRVLKHAQTSGAAPAFRSAAEPKKQLTAVYEGPLFIVLAVAAWALTAVNRWIVAGFFGAQSAGYFAMAGNLTIIITSMLGVVFVQYWQPIFFAMRSETLQERCALAARVDRIALAYTVCGLAGVAALHIAVPWLTGIFIDAKYAGAFSMIAPAGCFGVAVVGGQFFHMLLLAAHRERACVAADLSGACVLVTGGLAAAFWGEAWFLRWLLLTPLVPWLLQRVLARKALFAGCAGAGDSG